MATKHPGAGAGGCHDMVVALKGVEHLPGDRLGGGAITRIVGRLPAAGLSPRHLDCAVCVLQQLDGGKADGRPEEVHQASYKQRYTHRRSAHTRDPGSRGIRKLGVVRRKNQPVLGSAIPGCPSYYRPRTLAVPAAGLQRRLVSRLKLAWRGRWLSLPLTGVGTISIRQF